MTSKSLRRYFFLFALTSSFPSLAELPGTLDKEEIKNQFNSMRDQGIDLNSSYHWELRFTGKVMSNLEAFAQAAHHLGYWPVGLESASEGNFYWLYIQKSNQYNSETFSEDLFELGKIAEELGLSSFDGFSIAPIK